MTTDRQINARLLLQASRLLLEYNEASGALIHAVTATARSLTNEPCHVAVSYRGVSVSLGRDSPILETVKELRLNAAVQTRVHEVLDDVRRSRLDAPSALDRLDRVEADTPRHSRWLVALLIGAAASSFARLLGADVIAVAVAGLAAGLGLLARQELARRHVSLLALPLTAAFIGALLGGLAIRMGWTRSPELILVVPALIVVPGPHLINGLFDLIDNHLPMSLSRLGLATALLLASALGLVVGIALTIPGATFPEQSAGGDHLNLVSDMVLAGIATCGFAAFFNTPWRHMGMAAAGGMAGHGLRYLALQAGFQVEAATFFGGLVVGAISAWMAGASRAPVAVIAFAGAVTMIPGSTLYRGLAGALQLARLADKSDAALAASTLGHIVQGSVIVAGLALGLVLGIRLVLALAGGQDSADRGVVGKPPRG
jgi:uncharacterized membrane protein YjjP (DUF1212 family)